MDPDTKAKLAAVSALARSVNPMDLEDASSRRMFLSAVALLCR